MAGNIAHTVVDFWFAPEHASHWFDSTPSFDATIVERFNTLYANACDGKLEQWCSTPESALALILVLDQFPRNMFRGSAQAFATDEQALSVANDAIANGFDQKLTHEQRRFLYMPFMHSEVLAEQERGLELFKSLGNPQALDYMQRHLDIIARFGRFPHRNAVLKRETTPEEASFLSQSARHV